MNNNDKNQNNYVMPQNIDLDKVEVNNNQDNMLNRERDNIVSATIQVNQSVNEKKASTVNNQISIKKAHPFFRMLFVIFLLGIAIFLSYLVYKLASKAMNYDNNVTTTTTTTTSPTNKISNYLNKTSKVRKFQSDDNIIILSPSGYDLYSNASYFMNLTTSENGILEYHTGTYTINGEQLTLKYANNQEKIYEVSSSGLVEGERKYQIFDTEMKYYSYKSEEETKLLIINGTLKNEFALFIESNASSVNTTAINYTETTENITLDNGLQFIKNGNLLNYEKLSLELVY